MTNQNSPHKRKSSWQIQEAKAQFSELISEALTHGAQIITKHGKQIAILMSQEDFERHTKPKISFLDFFKKAPCQDIELDLQRNKELPREIEL